MVYSYENIEYFIFQNQHIALPDTIYYHFMGTSAISYMDNIALQDNDNMQIRCDLFSFPLENTIKKSNTHELIKAQYLR